jgi:hypothetical protein
MAVGGLTALQLVCCMAEHFAAVAGGPMAMGQALCSFCILIQVLHTYSGVWR